MNRVEVMVAILLLIAFIGGIVIGVVVIVSVASRREDRLYSLTNEAPDPLCEGTRRLIGASVRGHGFVSHETGPDWEISRETGPDWRDWREPP